MARQVVSLPGFALLADAALLSRPLLPVEQHRWLSYLLAAVLLAGIDLSLLCRLAAALAALPAFAALREEAE